MAQRRDLERNTAFFLGAFGMALGVLGGGLSALGIIAWLLPGFAQTAPDWFFGLVVVGLLALLVGGWPALDWLANRRAGVGALAMAVLGLAAIAIGLTAALWTPWGPTGWLAVAGGLIVLPAAYLTLVGGGTEPLTWRTLHRRSQVATVDPCEARATGPAASLPRSLAHRMPGARQRPSVSAAGPTGGRAISTSERSSRTRRR